MTPDFGTHKVGQVVIRYPRFALLFVLLTAIVCIFSIATSIRFDGEPSNIFSGNHKDYLAFQKLEKDFYEFSKDEVLIIESSSIVTTSGIEAIRDLSFDLQLSGYVDKVTSIFSVIQMDTQTGSWSSPLPPSFETVEDVKQTLLEFRKQNEAAKALLSADLMSTIIIYNRGKQSEKNEDGFKDDEALQAIIAAYENTGLSITRAGEVAIEEEIIDAVQRDSVVLTTLGIFVAIIISVVLFRSVRATIVCISPLTFALMFYLGITSIVGLPIDVITIIIPILVIVLAFADTIHLYLNWQHLRIAGSDKTEALQHSIKVIGPAIFLAALTTAIAFLILIITSSALLDRLAISGLIGMLTVYLSVILICPLAIYWMAETPQKKVKQPMGLLDLGGNVAIAFFLRSKGLAFWCALVAALPMMYIHFHIPSQYSLLDYLPDSSIAKRAELKMENQFGGTDQIILAVKRLEGNNTVSKSEIDTLRSLGQIVKRILETDNVFSFATVTTGAIKTPITLNVEDELTSGLLEKFLSRDQTTFAVTSPVSNSLNAAALNSRIEHLQLEIARSFPDLNFELSGSAKMKSAVAPELIEDLRTGLLISIFASTLLLAFVFRSWKAGLICLLPNVLPILVAQTYIWYFIGEMDLSIVIALMIGFGLAIDDTVHLLNRYYQPDNAHSDLENRIVSTLRSIGPALVATTLILGMSIGSTMFATLPNVTTFGVVLIVILIFALVADLLVLPSAIFCLGGKNKSM